MALLKEIREELKEIKLLYKGLVERLMPVEEPLEDEKEAIESSDEVVSDWKEIRICLRKGTNGDLPQRTIFSLSQFVG